MARKRSNGGGAVKKLASGNWRAQIMDGYRDDGKRNIISFTAKTKGEVLDKIRAYWNSKESAPKPEPNMISFREWADIWYLDYKTQVQPSTYCNYQYTLNILKNYFDCKPLVEIKPMHVNRFHDHLLSAGLSQSYITKCRSMLIQVFDAAEANEIIPYNPARKSKAIRVVAPVTSLDDEEESKKDAFTEDEQQFLHNSLPNNMDGHSIRLMLGTGMRTQELLALTPSDIAEDGSSITITKAIKTVNGSPTLGSPKSKRGKRIIPVPEDYRASAIFLRTHSGKPYIWTSKRKNGLFDVGVFRKRYYRVISSIPGVRRLSPHCCRHTYISNLEKNGIPMEQIARLAGHSRITTTDGYLHTDLATLSNAVSTLNQRNHNNSVTN